MYPLNDGILDLTGPGYRPDPDRDHGSTTDLFLRRQLVGTWKGDAKLVREFVEGALRRIHGGVLVDIACFSGLFSLRNQPVGREVFYIGLDTSIPLLKRAGSVLERQNVSGLVARADWEDLPLPAGSVQGLIAIQVLHQADNTVALLRELAGFVSDGGQLVLTVPFSDGPARHLERLQTRVTVMQEASWRQIFREQGLTILESAQTGSILMVRLGVGSTEEEE